MNLDVVFPRFRNTERNAGQAKFKHNDSGRVVPDRYGLDGGSGLFTNRSLDPLGGARVLATPQTELSFCSSHHAFLALAIEIACNGSAGRTTRIRQNPTTANAEWNDMFVAEW